MLTDLARAREALAAIPADMPREDWVRVAMAAKAAGLELLDFDQWSATAPDRYNATACRDTWKSINGTGGIGAGTLFHLASAHGWQERRATERPRPPDTPSAAAVWGRCLPAPEGHPYIRAKGGTPAGLRVVPAADSLTIAGQRLAGALAVPAYGTAGNLQSLQFIPAPGQGKKLNLAGATLSGAAFTLGTIQPGRPCYLVEGIGQAWACHQATGEAAVCCFGWGNIKTIAAALKAPRGPALVVVPDVGKEGQAAEVAKVIGAAVACLPAGLPPNHDVNDYAKAQGREALRILLEAVELPAPDRSRPPAAAALIPTEEELSAASLSPRCIVRHCLYADVAALVAPGGTGKTTLLIHEAVHIALGWPVWGLPVEAPGWTLFVTAEDRREQFMARLREILACLDLTPEQRARALWGVRVWDTTGEAVKLIRAADGNVVMTDLADDIVEAYQADPPAVCVFDPLVSFGASEGMVNDNEQGIITAARRIVKGLKCCVRVVHHTGKGNAREGALDQYAGRGGSALADGSRMMSVLQAWTPEASGNRQPPPGCTPAPEASIVILARAKLSYAPPNLPLIWIRREGFAFAHFTEEPRPAPEDLRAMHADQVERFIRAELERERFHTQKTLEEQAGIMGLARQAIREALSELRISGRIIDAPMPEGLRHGGRKSYLSPPDNLAAPFGEVAPEKAENDPGLDPTSPPSTTSPPYRGSNPGEVEPGFTDPHPDNRAANDWRGTARLARYTEGKVIEEVLI
jgi:RecA-family ATPase